MSEYERGNLSPEDEGSSFFDQSAERQEARRGARRTGDPAGPSGTAPRRRKGKGALITLATVVVLGAAAYVGAAVATQNKLPAHLTVEGVDVSGQNKDEARATLASKLEPRTNEPVKLTAGEDSVSVKPKDAGLGLDLDGTIADLTGFTWNPATIASRIFGSQDAAARTTTDQKKLSAAVDAAAEQLDREPTEGSDNLSGGKLDFTEPRDGVSVKKTQTAKAIAQRWLRSDGAIQADVSNAKPTISTDTWKKFNDETAAPLVDGDITVKEGKEQARLTPAQLGDAATVETAGGKPELKLDGTKLLDAVVKDNSSMKSSGRDARVKLTGSGAKAHPEVVPSKDGSGIEAGDLVAAVQKASLDSSRTADVKKKKITPDVTTKTAEGWGVKDKVAKFSTPYPADDTVRTKNLRAGASRVNGTVVMPGKQFSLAKALGPVTEANGYFKSGVVEDGLSTTAVGGGLSQIATMSYNAGFLSGMDILEHKPHSRWFDRYPAGRESTYWEGNIDVRWKNNTSSPVIVQMWVSSDAVNMQVWGKKTWDVKTKTSDHYNITHGSTIHSSGAQCVPENTGKTGFTVTVTRDRKSSSKTLPQEKYTWTYQPWPHVICDKK